MSGVPANVVFESRGADLYALEGRVDLSTVSRLMAVGTSALAGSTNPTISLAGASAEGSAILALLIGWQRDCHQRGCRLIFADVPEPLRRIAEASEVAQLLGVSAGS